MICDLCNCEIVGSPACLLGTKDVVTTKECWTIYLKSLIADKLLNLYAVRESLPALVSQMASSDTPWALCENCKQSLNKSGLPLHLTSKDLPVHGHALCRSAKPLAFKVIDEVGMMKASTAAHLAALELITAN